MRFAKTILVILFSMLGALTTRGHDANSHRFELADDASRVFERELHLAGLDRRSGIAHARQLCADRAPAHALFQKIPHVANALLDFFRGGYAIHGTYATGALEGRLRMAACACRRLTPPHSIIWSKRGGSISITGRAPAPARFAAPIATQDNVGE